MRKILRSLLPFVALATPLTGAAQSEEHGKRVPAAAYFKEGKLHFGSSDGSFDLWFDNRINIDAGFYSPHSDIDGLAAKANKDIEDDDGTFRFSNGMIIRRARFAIKATLHEKWFAELDLDFAYNEIEMKDMYLGYRFNDKLSLKAGNFKEPMSMERLTSSRYLINMEHPMAVDVFAGGRKLGIVATAWGNHWWVSGGVFGREASVIQKERNRGNDGYGFTARAALSPINDATTTLHIGAYGTYRVPDQTGKKDKTVVFRCFPESRVDRRRFVRTEIDNVNNYYTTGLELAMRHNKWLVYGEYIFTDLSRYRYENGKKVGLKNATFDGWYVTGSYMIIGNNRTYDSSDAEFGNMAITPKTGNLELVGRISTVNMNDFNDPSAVITRGKATAYSASLNWYPVRNVLLGLNYIYMDNDKYADDKGQITGGGQALKYSLPEGIDFSVFQLRLLVSF